MLFALHGLNLQTTFEGVGKNQNLKCVFALNLHRQSFEGVEEPFLFVKEVLRYATLPYLRLSSAIAEICDCYDACLT